MFRTRVQLPPSPPEKKGSLLSEPFFFAAQTHRPILSLHGGLKGIGLNVDQRRRPHRPGSRHQHD